MPNTYIVELFKWDNEKQLYEKKDDCLLSLDSLNGTLKLESSKTEKVLYLSVNIVNENILILSRERNNVASMYNPTFTIDYEMFYDGKKFGIRFDSRSSASETNFITEFKKCRSKVQAKEYYRSGNIKCEGTKTDTGFNGMCIEYYDRNDSPIKYMGEFEDGQYDGQGEFFSEDGNIRLICRNICAGKPTGLGKLIVGKNKLVKQIAMKDFTEQSTDVKYTNNIYARIEPKHNEFIELINFESLSTDDKLVYLFKELQKLKLGKNMETSSVAKSVFNIF